MDEQSHFAGQATCFCIQLFLDEVYSATSIFTESNLHSVVLQTILTPKLGPLIPNIRDELDYAMIQELPDFDTVHW